MKKLIVLLAMFVAGTSQASILDGKAYCRIVNSGGLFGQPVGESSHCITFENGVASDNSNVFFGNPPEFSPYVVVGSSVLFGSSEYTLSIDQNTLTTVIGSTVPGTVFDLQ